MHPFPFHFNSNKIFSDTGKKEIERPQAFSNIIEKMFSLSAGLKQLSYHSFSSGHIMFKQ